MAHHSRRIRRPRHGALLESLEPRLLLSSTPTGAVNVFNRTQISGWATNADDGQGPVDIEITINGTKTTIKADDPRLDLTKLLSPYHGFTFTPPVLPMGNSKVLIQAVSESTGVRRTLKSGVLTNPVPASQIQVASATRLMGWAYDPDMGGPLNLRLDIDGVAGTPFAADIARTSVANPRHYNTTMIGFNLTGNYAGHVVELYAIEAPTGQAKLIYTNNKKPVGKVEVNNGFVVSGWALDPDNKAASITIRVDIDGVTISGTPVLASLDRPDLLKNYSSSDHGFSVAIAGLTPGTHVISVYAIDGQAGGQAPVLIGSKSVTNRPPVGKVQVATGSLLSGWALDRDLGTMPATVNVYVDGTVLGSYAASVSRPELVHTYGSANHGFSIDLSALSAGSHAITVTVDDNRTSDQPEVVIFDGFINNHVPTGSFETITGSSFAGWAFDSDAPDQAIAVDVYVDGVYTTTVAADQPRPDLVGGTLPSADHGFSGSLPVLKFGKHRIDLYAAESQGNVSVLIGSKTVTNARTIGAIESSNATTLTGWAADPDRLGESVTIKVFINAALAASVTANVDRPDLATLAPLSTLPGYTAYGFAIDLPTLDPGRNQIDLYAVDLNNGLLTPLRSVVLNV